MINLKRIDAPQTTVTYDKNKIDAQTGNIYEAISIIAKRASQMLPVWASILFLS